MPPSSEELVSILPEMKALLSVENVLREGRSSMPSPDPLANFSPEDAGEYEVIAAIKGAASDITTPAASFDNPSA